MGWQEVTVVMDLSKVVAEVEVLAEQVAESLSWSTKGTTHYRVLSP